MRECSWWIANIICINHIKMSISWSVSESSHRVYSSICINKGIENCTQYERKIWILKKIMNSILLCKPRFLRLEIWNNYTTNPFYPTRYKRGARGGFFGGFKYCPKLGPKRNSNINLRKEVFQESIRQRTWNYAHSQGVRCVR